MFPPAAADNQNFHCVESFLENLKALLAAGCWRLAKPENLKNCTLPPQTAKGLRRLMSLDFYKPPAASRQPPAASFAFNA
jgi:hypothetical protein